MIDSGKRVVTFLDNQADFTQVPYIIDGPPTVSEQAPQLTTYYRVLQRLGDSVRRHRGELPLHH